jgi:hypothetical protein
MRDTKPDKRQHVETDPGLGRPKVTTTPGPPEIEPIQVVDRSALTPPEASSPLSPSRWPVAVRFGGEPTPLPLEATEGLLSGLIESENEAYFRKTKPSSESSGESAAAFHGAPHSVQPGIATPLPEPAVMLRSSLERDLAEVAKATSQPTAAAAALEETQRIARRRDVSHDPTLTLAPPRSTLADKWIAFGVAVVTVAAIGILGVRWLWAENPPIPTVGAGKGGTNTVPIGTAVSAIPTPTALAIPMPIATATTIPAPTAAAAQTPTATPTPTEGVAPAGAPAVRGGSKVEGAPPRAAGSAGRPQHAGGAASAPPQYFPPPKDDIKRTM